MYNLILDDECVVYKFHSMQSMMMIIYPLLFRISLVFWIGEAETKTRHFQQMMMSKAMSKCFFNGSAKYLCL